MARTGISYEVVAQAAEQLKAEGKNATIENIRFITGTGSSTTIAMHLRTWKGYCEKAKSLSEDILPEGIILTMKGLWTHVIKEAQDQIAPIKQNLEQRVAELNEQLQVMQKENTQWQQQHQQLMLEKDTVDNEIIVLRQLNHQLENDKIALVATQASMTKQFQDKQDRIDELHLLNEQAQANLEHYREAAREQRILDEQRHQQTQLQLEQTIAQINQELICVKQENLLFQKKNEQINFEKNNLETQINKLNEQHVSMVDRLTESLNEIAKRTHAEQHWQELYHALTVKWDEQNKLFMELQTQHALSLQEKAAIKTKAEAIAEQNKLLAHEKWILGQEKAQLYGQLQQLQKMSGNKELHDNHA